MIQEVKVPDACVLTLWIFFRVDDLSRVVLHNVDANIPGSDYINASYIFVSILNWLFFCCLFLCLCVVYVFICFTMYEVEGDNKVFLEHSDRTFLQLYLSLVFTSE